jgi:hypothetical protein
VLKGFCKITKIKLRNCQRSLKSKQAWFHVAWRGKINLLDIRHSSLLMSTLLQRDCYCLMNSCTSASSWSEPAKLAQQQQKKLSATENFQENSGPVNGTRSHPRNSCKWVDRHSGMLLMTFNSKKCSWRNLSSNVAKHTWTIHPLKPSGYYMYHTL